MPNTNKEADKVSSVKIQDCLKKIANTQIKTKLMIDDLTQKIINLSERIGFIEKRVEILEKKNFPVDRKSRPRRTYDV